ncbi:MAG TPA: GNAT family N-acetyltransferase [Ktedonobacteraceae bacterium]|nr:GNAT family N-acetyltransferase [Ktedonobacteraceae bacterium]
MAETPQEGEQTSLVSPSFRIATSNDIALIEYLDSFSSSPKRNIHQELEKYFGSVDPSTHERTVIFLAERGPEVIAKAELMLPPQETSGDIGYIRRVIVHPDRRRQGLAHQLIQYLITYARDELHLAALYLHVWEENRSAIRLYEALGFHLQHRELYMTLTLDPDIYPPDTSASTSVL